MLILTQLDQLTGIMINSNIYSVEFKLLPGSLALVGFNVPKRCMQIIYLLSLLIYDLQSEDSINTYYMVMAF